MKRQAVGQPPQLATRPSPQPVFGGAMAVGSVAGRDVSGGKGAGGVAGRDSAGAGNAGADAGGAAAGAGVCARTEPAPASMAISELRIPFLMEVPCKRKC